MAATSSMWASGLVATCAALAMVPCAALAQAARPAATRAQTAPAAGWSDPFAYCAAVADADAPDARWKGPRVPAVVVRVVAPEGPLGEAAVSRTAWRCMGGKVYGCWTGGGGRSCSAKPTDGTATDARGFATSRWTEIVPAPAPAGAPALAVSDKDNGATLTVSRGGTVEVTLAGNPTTGYSWALESHASGVLSAVGEPTYEASSALVGAGGRFTFVFTATAPGRASLRFAYKRPWQAADPDAKAFVVTIIVK